MTCVKFIQNILFKTTENIKDGKLDDICVKRWTREI